MAHFEIGRNLPHGATVARRLRARLASRMETHADAEMLLELVEELCESLSAYEGAPDPPEDEAEAVAAAAAGLGRSVVIEIERLEAGEDRTGQLVRNLFECLGLGEEGAAISLRAGESPTSLMRPG